MALLQLPSELLFEICGNLDYKSLSAISQTSRHFNQLAKEPLVWQKLYKNTFSKPRTALSRWEWQDLFTRRVQALRELLIRGTNDFHASTVRRIFSEMNPSSSQLIDCMMTKSSTDLRMILLEGQSFIMSSSAFYFPSVEAPAGAESYFGRLSCNETPGSMRSEAHLVKLLLARAKGFQMNASLADACLKLNHLITYDSEQFPIYIWPEPKAPLGEYAGASVNWGVVETIHALIKFYRDIRCEAIPGFNKSEDDYESEVPMSAEMFDADLSGNWIGLYGYLDFRDLAILGPETPVTPDYFDGLSRLKFSAETPRHAASDGETGQEDPANMTFERFLALQHDSPVESDWNETQGEDDDDDSQDRDWNANESEMLDAVDEEADVIEVIDELEEDGDDGAEFQDPGDDDFDDDYDEEQERATFEGLKSMLFDRRKFSARGSSRHGQFRINGSTSQLKGMEPGFKVVDFDEMYNSDGLMPWIMSGVYIPSIGIIGRWSDRHADRDGVFGPYVLWRDRSQDLRDQEAAQQDYHRKKALGEDVVPPELCEVRHLKRPDQDLAYIIIEELSKITR